MKNDNALFYTCSLIEYIGREQKLQRKEVVNTLGKDYIKRIYTYSDVFHCEQIAKVADDFITLCNIPKGDFDNVSSCKYEVPDYWTIGEVYKRLIEDVTPDDNSILSTLNDVYNSWISDSISNYNSDFFYQTREYIALCFKEGEVVE